MRKLFHTLLQWLRATRPDDELRAPRAEVGLHDEHDGRDLERAFAWHGMDEHEWEGFEE